jgi:ABC-type multidrug transport system ATPase subunit
MQRSVRENIALPFRTQLSRWGLINLGEERRQVDSAIETLQIDTRAHGEVRRLSGGNQQKVTIARWIAGGVKTMVCFDPTRGIDIRTKRQIYALLRDLAEAGAAILLYTSELKEVQLVCDRAIVIFGGRVVREIVRADADEPALLRAAYNLRSDSALPEDAVAEIVGHPDAAIEPVEREAPSEPVEPARASEAAVPDARSEPVEPAPTAASPESPSRPRVGEPPDADEPADASKMDA